MADEEDVRLLLSGTSDLSRCDFRGAELRGLDLRKRDFDHADLREADFTGSNFESTNLQGAKWNSTNLSKCDCRSVNFNGSIFQVNFTEADLRDAIFSGLLHECIFEGADLRGADFSRATFNESASFANARINRKTNFHGAQMPRPLSRSPIFGGYKFERGALVSLDETSEHDDADDAEEDISFFPDASKYGQNRIAQRLAANREDLVEFAISLRGAIHDALSEMHPPNEPEQLDRFEALSGILKEVADGLARIADHLIRARDASATSQVIHEAAASVSTLRTTLDAWLSTNRDRLVNYGAKTALLGAGSAFLGFCGAPAEMAFPAVALLLEGDRFANAFVGRKSAEEIKATD